MVITESLLSFEMKTTYKNCNKCHEKMTINTVQAVYCLGCAVVAQAVFYLKSLMSEISVASFDMKTSSPHEMYKKSNL